jgi:hypothetical protein
MATITTEELKSDFDAGIWRESELSKILAARNAIMVKKSFVTTLINNPNIRKIAYAMARRLMNGEKIIGIAAPQTAHECLVVSVNYSMWAA